MNIAKNIKKFRVEQETPDFLFTNIAPYQVQGERNMATSRLKKKLDELAEQAKMSGQSEFRCLTDFLTECYEPRNQENLNLLLTICNEFIDHATYIKKELSKCRK